MRRADLGTDEIAYHTAQNLYSMHTPTVRVTLQLRGYPVSENTRGRMRFIFNLKVAERALSVLLLNTLFFDGSERVENAPAHSLFLSMSAFGGKADMTFCTANVR